MANNQRRGSRPLFPGGIDGDILERMMSPKYYSFFERFYQKPSIAADYTLTTETLHEQFNQAWIVTGTNATGSLATAATKGGLLLTTAGADGDNMIIVPHTTANYGAIKTRWDTDSSLLFATNLVSGATALTTIAWAGWKLTNTPVVATDADQCYFRVETGATTIDGTGNANSGKWVCVYSINDVDATIDTGIPYAASTLYRLVIKMGADRIPEFYINDARVGPGVGSVAAAGALRDLATFEPQIGIGADGAAIGATMTVRNVLMSQLF